MNAEQQDHERAVQKVRQARHDTGRGQAPTMVKPGMTPTVVKPGMTPTMVKPGMTPTVVKPGMTPARHDTDRAAVDRRKQQTSDEIRDGLAARQQREGLPEFVVADQLADDGLGTGDDHRAWTPDDHGQEHEPRVPTVRYHRQPNDLEYQPDDGQVEVADVEDRRTGMRLTERTRKSIPETKRGVPKGTISYTYGSEDDVCGRGRVGLTRRKS